MYGRESWEIFSTNRFRPDNCLAGRREHLFGSSRGTRPVLRRAARLSLPRSRSSRRRPLASTSSANDKLNQRQAQPTTSSANDRLNQHWLSLLKLTLTRFSEKIRRGAIVLSASGAVRGAYWRTPGRAGCRPGQNNPPPKHHHLAQVGPPLE
jgi:hypothetical protein